MFTLNTLTGLVVVQMMFAGVQDNTVNSLLETDKKLHKMSITTFKNNLIYNLSELREEYDGRTFDEAPLTKHQKLLTDRYDCLNGKPSLTLEVPTKVAKLLLTLNSNNIRKGLMLTVDGEGRIVDYSSGKLM